MPDDVKLGIEEITPERALELLCGNTNNRTIRVSKVAEYARDMRKGNWKPGAGDPLHIAPGGLIGNGQHRLHAILEAEMTISMPVLRAPLTYRTVADQGLRRTFGDALKIEHKVGNGTRVAACVRLLREYRLTGEIGRRTTYTMTELMETFEEEPNLDSSSRMYTRASDSRSHRRTGVNPSVSLVLHYLFSETDPEEVGPFFDKFQTGAGLDQGDAILAARRFFANTTNREVRTHAAILIKAFNAWREGKQVTTLSWRGGGSSPEPFPKINPAIEETA